MGASFKGGTVTMDGTAKSLSDWLAIAEIAANVYLLQALGANANPIYVGTGASIAATDADRFHSINPGGTLGMDVITGLNPKIVMLAGTIGDKLRILEIGY